MAVVLAVVSMAILTDILLRPAPDGAPTQIDGAAQSPSSGLPLRAMLTPTQVRATPTAGTPDPCIAPGDWGTHIVQQGDTLYSLAQHYGSDVETLKRVNCLKASTILIRQPLYVPGPLALPTHATPTPAGAMADTRASSSEPGASATPEVAVELPTVEVSIPKMRSQSQPALRPNIPDRFLNIVLLGLDVRPEGLVSGYNFGRRSSAWRTDAIVIVSLDVQDHVARVLHVPRDLWVYIPRYGNDRINTAHMRAELEDEGSGPERVKQTIYHNLGIPIHYYVQMDFQGFIEVVDAIGGADVAVPCPMPDLELEPGLHHMNGAQLLRYVHRRKDNSDDFARGQRVSEVLMTLWDQALTPGIIPKVPELWVTMSENFQTDLPLDQVVDLGYLGLQLKAQDIRMKSPDSRHLKDWTTPEGAMVLLPREDELVEFLEGFYAPEDTAPRKRVDKARIQVLNGWPRYQAEELAAAALKQKGFRIVNKGQADRQDLAQTQIIVRRGDLAVGEQIAWELDVPSADIQDMTIVPDPPNPSDRVDIRIILGSDYDPCQR
jgi:LCP family protein required for cell wall assembly